MNTTTSSVLPLTAIAYLFTPKQWFDWFGLDSALLILEAQRKAKNRREVLLIRHELEPVGYDGFGAPLCDHNTPA